MKLPLNVSKLTMDSSHTKAHLLLQAHFSRLALPSSDYYTDTKSLLDQTVRVLQVTVFMYSAQTNLFGTCKRNIFRAKY